ncbi:hypothetical protein AAHA92_17589 [Salvia divinorum]|uniref:Secreted protein n=1 Tax=Salvia divinorum TaxID=28513 RepID=A0ABD1H2G7_SALDI
MASTAGCLAHPAGVLPLSISLTSSISAATSRFAATAEPSSETAYLRFPSPSVHRRVGCGLVQPTPRLSSPYLAIARCRAFFLSRDSSATVTSAPFRCRLRSHRLGSPIRRKLS